MALLRAAIGLVFVVTVAGVTAAANADDIRIGVLAFEGPKRAFQDFEPTLKQLERSLPGRRIVMTPLDVDGVTRAVAEKGIDFIITNPGQYIDLEARFGVTRLAGLETRMGGAPVDSVGSVVIAPAGPSAPRALADLVGLRIATASTRAFGGYEALWREMDDAGLSPTQFGATVETGFPMDRVIDALRDGRADAGVLRVCLLETEIEAGRVRAGEFVVVAERPTPGFPCHASTRLYPDWPFAKTVDTPPNLAKAVAVSLLTMPEADGRAWTVPQDFGAVRALFQQLKIGPYQRPEQRTIVGLLRDYWRWAAGVVFVIGWWVAHVARVEILVRRRTAELEQQIIERERAEREARSNREQRDQFSRLGILGEMAGTIAHELNQPLAAIANYAEGMTRMIDGGRADREILRDGALGISGQAERAAAIIRRIRSFVRRREVTRETIDPNDVVREALVLFEGAASRRGVVLSAHLADGLPRVCVDRIEIEQVLLNLLQNAVDATVETGKPGGVTVRSSRVGADVKIAVRDDGPGLTPEVDAHLFEPFFTTKRHGLGLGLSICRTIVEGHGGRLWAAANEHSGLTMRFTLPGVEAEATT